MRLYYDFHIHTALSPCGDLDMTPNNIVNMSILKGLDAIAITDHNTCKNVLACIEVGRENGIIVLPAIEVESQEAIHSICIFPNIEGALSLEEEIKKNLPPIKNRADIFGRQVYLDSLDNEIGEEEILLLNSCDLSIFEIRSITLGLGGIFYPAHIDRDSYSVISSLGYIPHDLYLRNVEVSKNADFGFIEKYKNYYNIIHSSDAHYLQDISERENFIEVLDKSIDSIFNVLR